MISLHKAHFIFEESWLKYEIKSEVLFELI